MLDWSTTLICLAIAAAIFFTGLTCFLFGIVKGEDNIKREANRRIEQILKAQRNNDTWR